MVRRVRFPSTDVDAHIIDITKLKAQNLVLRKASLSWAWAVAEDARVVDCTLPNQVDDQEVQFLLMA